MDTVAFSNTRDAYLIVALFLGFAALIPFGKWAMARGRFQAPESVEKPLGCFLPLAVLIFLFCASTQFRRVFSLETGPTEVRARYLQPRFARTIPYDELATASVIRHASEPPKFWLALRTTDNDEILTQATESREDALRAATRLRDHGVALRWVVREAEGNHWTPHAATEEEVFAE